MKLAFGLTKFVLDAPHVVTIGNFDGVHLGHQHVIAQTQAAARARNLPTCVVVFEPQPREYFAAQQGQPPPARLMTLSSKVRALQELGVDLVWCLKFPCVRALTAEAFVSDVLVRRMHAAHVIVGDDFRFGCDRRGDFTRLLTLGSEIGFSVAQSETLSISGQRVSSSRIREALERHDFVQAAELLGRPYQFVGTVCYGRQLGRTLGFPTANIRLSRRPPIAGVFACEAITAEGQRYTAVANIGTRPTVSGVGVWLEVHLHQASVELYGHALTVIPRFFLRPEQKFASVDALREGIAADSARALALLSA